jgi:hypothetical protein
MSTGSFDDSGVAPPKLLEVLPKAGLVYSEKGNLSEVLCKPKIMPIKSPSLEKLEQMEKNTQGAEHAPIPEGGAGEAEGFDARPRPPGAVKQP